MPAGPHAAASNGHAPTGDEAIVAPLKARVDELHAQRDVIKAQRDELTARIDEITAEARRYEKAMTVLAGEPLRAGRPRAGDGDDDEASPKQRKREKPSGVSEEKLARIEAVIRQMAADKDDVTQVDVRAITGGGSGTTALAFEALRQRNVIRLVRREGNLKVFRLTREALAESAAE